MRPHGTPRELERRRLRALELLDQGVEPHVVAERIGVDRRSVRRWSKRIGGGDAPGSRLSPLRADLRS